MKILVINGPNLNLLGTREPEIYGDLTLEKINSDLKNLANELNVEVDFFQSNIEGEIIDKLHYAKDNFNAIIINAGGYTHTSVAIRDAIIAIAIPTLEVHISNIHTREEFRRNSLISEVCIGQITGLNEHSYTLALRYFAQYFQNN